MNDTLIPPAPTDPTQVFTTFTNSAGQKFTIHGLSPITPHKIMDSVKADLVKNGKGLPVVPTYEVIIAPEGVEIGREIHVHDEKSILEGTPEQVKIDQDAWNKYQDLSNELNREYNSRIMKSVLLTVQVEPTQTWRDDMKFIGIDLPVEGSSEERYLFLETSVIKNHADLSKLTLIAFQSAGIIKEEMTAEVEATFRSFMERAFIEAGRREGKR